MTPQEHKAEAERIGQAARNGIQAMAKWSEDNGHQVDIGELLARQMDIQTTIALGQLHATLATTWEAPAWGDHD